MNKELFSITDYNGAKDFKSIELGFGDISIFDIAKDSIGRAGIGFKYNPGLEVGDDAGFSGLRLDKVNPDLIVITDNVESLKVLLDKVEKAIAHLSK